MEYEFSKTQAALFLYGTVSEILGQHNVFHCAQNKAQNLLDQIVHSSELIEHHTWHRNCYCVKQLTKLTIPENQQAIIMTKIVLANKSNHYKDSYKDL